MDDLSVSTQAEPKRTVFRLVAGLVVIGLFTGACQMLFGVTAPSGPRFPHSLHVEEIDCTTCHDGADNRADAGFPATTNGCMLCHKDIDAKKPREKTVAAFLVEGKPRWLNRPNAYGGEVRFDHGKHADAEVDCSTCHASIEQDAGPGLQLHGGKATCLACHEKTAKGGSCEVCHKVLRRDTPPPNHRVNWTRSHGANSRRMIAGTGQTTCVQCHASEEACNRCHREQPPSNHSHFWRIRGHGLAASVDRSNCVTCHQVDYCSGCHRSTQPRSHRGSFGPPRNRHCVTCHLSPSSRSGCSVCHDNVPVHEGGSPPGNLAHMTAKSPGDCLTCHLALKHANPGGDCRQCHK